MAKNLWQLAGGAVGAVGNIFGIPERGWSERVSSIGSRAQPIGPQSTNPSLQPGRVLSAVDYVNQTRVPTGYNNASYGGNAINQSSVPSGNLPSGPGPTPTPGPGPTPDTGGDPFAEQRRIAEEQARRELDDAMREFDRYSEEAQAQVGSYERQQAETLSGLETQRGRVGTEAKTAKEEAASLTQSERDRALQTAQGTQRKNRNVLRALGILSSSAAGEMLNKPLEEYNRTSNELGLQFNKRVSQVDDWLRMRGEDIDAEVGRVKGQFTDIISQINRDIRFTGEQKASAVRAAGQALQQRLAEIGIQAQSYKQAAAEYNNNILGQIAQLKLYQNPKADISGILSSMIQPLQGYQSGQASQVMTDEDVKKRLGLLSGPAY